MPGGAEGGQGKINIKELKMNGEQSFRFAGFWMRFAAALIDGIILCIAGAITGGLAGIIVGAMVGRTGFGILIGWLYYALMESSETQATLGKMAMGIKVTDLNGGRISFGRATGRHFGKIVSVIILFIGFIMAGWTQKKQALHDIMAECLVVIKSI